jgi:alkylphosphonate utilization operon protein PhnA
MSKPVCPMCETSEVLEHPERWECVTCGHEWERTPEPEAAAGPRVVKDAHGNVLADGDCVMLIKDLPLKGSSQVLKGGSPNPSGWRPAKQEGREGWRHRPQDRATSPSAMLQMRCC